jgi:hypothetical protein
VFVDEAFRALRVVLWWEPIVSNYGRLLVPSVASAVTLTDAHPPACDMSEFISTYHQRQSNFTNCLASDSINMGRTT